MKYVITWKRKRHSTTADYEAGERRVLDLMRDWRRPAGVRIHEFLVRSGDTGGYAVIETDNLQEVHLATAAFSGMNFHIDPVQDIDVALAARGVTVAWRGAAG